MSKITINEAISYFDEICINQISKENKIKWLSELDEQIYNEIIKGREGEENITFTPYTYDDESKELLVGTPYTEIYRYWLQKSVDYINREINSMNNANAMFNTYFEAFMSYYIRTHQSTENEEYIL